MISPGSDIVVSLLGQILLEHEVQFYSSFIFAQNYIVHRQLHISLYLLKKMCAAFRLHDVTPSYQVSHSFPGKNYQSNNEIKFLNIYMYIYHVFVFLNHPKAV